MSINLLIILLVWQFFPIVLVALLIILFCKYRALKEKYEFLCRQGITPEPMHPMDIPAPPQAEAFPQPAPAPYEPSRQPSPAQVHTGQYASAPPSYVIPVPTKEEQTKRVVNLTLIIGMLFILTAGLIFATTTWNIISSGLKVCCIALFAVIFFGTSMLIRKFLKIRMTEIAFYHLGSLFLCATVIAIGYFQIIGQWFSLGGEGRPFVFLVTMIFLLGLSMWGYRCYQSQHLYYLSWASSACIVWLLTESLGSDTKVCWLMVWIYGTGVATRMIFKKGRRWLIYVHPIMVFSCLTLAVDLFISHKELSMITWILAMSMAFAFYRLSTRYLSVSLESPCSHFLYAGMLFFFMLVSGGIRDQWIQMIAAVAVCVCLWSLFEYYEERISKYLLAGFIVLCIGFIEYFMITVLIDWLYLPDGPSIALIFSLFFCGIILSRGISWESEKRVYFRHLIPILAAVMTCFGVLYCGFDWYGLLITLELAVLFMMQREPRPYIPVSAVIFMFLPMLALKNIVQMYSVERQLSILCTAFLIYLLSGYMKKDYMKSVFKWTSVVGLFGGLILFFFSFWEVCYPFGDKYWLGFLAMSAILIATICGWKKNDAILYAPTIFLGPIACCTLQGILYEYQRWFILPIFLMSIILMAAGRVRYPGIYQESRIGGRIVRSMDILGISAVTGVCGVVFAEHALFWLCIFMAVWSANFYGRNIAFLNHFSLGALITWGYGMWLTQPFVRILWEHKVLYWIAGLLLSCVAVKMIWRKYEQRVDVYWIVIAGLCTAAQGMMCLSWGRLSDVLILGGAMIGILFFAYRKKEFRWLTLSLGTLAALVLYISRDFWLNLTWWAFLLIAGFVLIGIAARHEYTKRRKKEKEDSAFGDWKW